MHSEMAQYLISLQLNATDRLLKKRCVKTIRKKKPKIFGNEWGKISLLCHFFVYLFLEMLVTLLSHQGEK